MGGENWQRGDPASLLAYVNRSPFYRLLGFEAVEVGEGLAKIRLPVTEDLLQFQGAVHGGALFAIADAAVAVALMTLLEPGDEVLTVEGKLNYLAPAREGELWAVGRVAHRGRRLALGEVEVRTGGGDLLAKGLMTYAVRRPRPTPGKGG